MTTKPFWPKVFSLAGLCFAHAPAMPELDARGTLQRALERQRSVDYVRIESRPGSPGGPEWRLNVQTVAKLGIKVRILAPISQEGVVSIDDAKELRTFFPDEDTVLVQPSPYLLQPNLEWRLKLIEKNYKVRFGGTSSIAGQAVREVVLQPVNPGIPVRKMYVDSKHDVVLKYVVEPVKGSAIVVFDTKSVIFGRVAAAQDFELPDEAKDANIHRRKGPTTIKSPGDSRRDAEFSARLVSSLPYGFKESGAYVFKDARGAYVGVKLSDGMATLTLYQWKASRFKSAPSRDIRGQRSDSYGISYGIAVSPGDKMPESVLEKIVDTYVVKSE